MQSAQNTWYVQVQGQSYGPYTAEHMQGFVKEGRVTAQSIISRSPTQGYAPAAQFSEFGAWSGQPQIQEEPLQLMPQHTQVLRPMSNVGGGVLARQMQPVGHAPQAVAPSPALERPQMTPQTVPQLAPQPMAQPAANTVFIVMAEIRSQNGMAFLQALQNEGTAQRIGDSVWLLRSGTSVEQLRNRLSQTLTREDRLFLLDSFQNETAWFNIGSDMDVRIRELWDMER